MKRDKVKARLAVQANTRTNKFYSVFLLCTIFASTYLSIALNIHARSHVYNGWAAL